MNNDKVSDVYKGILKWPETEPILRARIHWMCSQVVGPRVLDLGCSQGITSILLAREGFEVTGVDVEPPAIDYAEADRAQESSAVQSRLRFLLGDAFALPEDLGQFNTLIMGEVIEHFTCPTKLISCALDHLVPEGRLIVTTPFGLLPHPDHKTTFDLSSLIKALPSGLQCEHLDVLENYIRFVCRKSGCGSIEIPADELLAVTEKALIEAQARHFNTAARLKERLEQKDTAIKNLQASESGAKQSLRQLQTEFNTFKDAAVSKSLNEQRERERKDNADLRLSQEALNKVSSDLKLSEAELERLRKENAELKLSQEELKEVRSDLKLSEAELERLRKDNAELKLSQEELKEVRSELKLSEAELERLRQENAELKLRQEELTEAPTELKLSEAELERLRQENTDLKRSGEELERVRNELKRSHKDLEKLRDDLKLSHDQLERVRDDLRLSREQLEKLNKDSADLKLTDEHLEKVSNDNADLKLRFEQSATRGDMELLAKLRPNPCSRIRSFLRLAPVNERADFLLMLPAGTPHREIWRWKRDLDVRFIGDLIQASNPAEPRSILASRNPINLKAGDSGNSYPAVDSAPYRITIRCCIFNGAVRLRWMGYDARERVQQEQTWLSNGRTILRVTTLPSVTSFAFALEVGKDCLFRVISIDVALEGKKKPLAIPQVEAEKLLPPLPRNFTKRKLRAIEGTNGLRVAAIVDEFTLLSFGPECTLLQLTPDHWEKEISAFKPDFLFVESAWRGKDGLWNRKVAYISAELFALIAWCRRQGVATVFWNKEDPVHFETFISTAELFDFVFTTDIDCIKRYKTILQHDNVHLLAFAAQPKLHNPIEITERKDAFCFAGAYYSARYPERQRDIEVFANVTHSEKGLEIYDRNFNEVDPNYKFPERFAPMIVGTLRPEQIDKAYKGYRYAINMNSVKQSQSMFARRVYELLASNTVVASNFSRAVRLLFGDLVICTDDEGSLRSDIRKLSSTESYYRKLRLAGLRKVMSEHTSGDRFAYLAETIFEMPKIERLPRISGFALVQTDEELNSVIHSFERQKHPVKQFVVVLSERFAPAQMPSKPWLQIVAWTEALASKMKEIATEGWVAGISPNDYYGENYLLDYALATRYSDASILGKGVFYASTPDGIAILKGAGNHYKAVTTLSMRAGMCSAALIHNASLADFASQIERGVWESDKALSLDEFNYCQNFSGESCPTADDLAGLELGIEMAALETASKKIAMEPHRTLAKSYTAKEISSAVVKDKTGSISMLLSGGNLQFESRLPAKKNQYLYARDFVTCEALGFAQSAKLFFDVSPGLQIQFVLQFLDKHKGKLGNMMVHPNRNGSKPIPEGTAWIKWGVRIEGSGTCSVRRVLFDHIETASGCFVGDASTLVVSNHYPEYSDLYRYGFLHRRVLAYKRAGMSVNVFRFNEKYPSGYFEFEGIDVISGCKGALQEVLSSGTVSTVLVHFLDAQMWSLFKPALESQRVIVWLHGVEVQPWWRREFNLNSEEEKNRAIEASDKRMALWREVFSCNHPNLHFVFVSRTFAKSVMDDYGMQFAPDRFSVIHNVIDTEMFRYVKKQPEQRKRILSIRPFASRTYANDLTVKAILELSKEPLFSDLEFRLIGDGPLFEETVAPLRAMANVILEKRFLRHDEMAALHREYGIFLVPTRMDSQGVSRDEAMAAGLVPVTTRVAAVPEFVDERCGMLVEGEDYAGLAKAIVALYHDPELFLRLSQNASERVHCQSSYGETIRKEIELISEGARTT